MKDKTPMIMFLLWIAALIAGFIIVEVQRASKQNEAIAKVIECNCGATVEVRNDK